MVEPTIYISSIHKLVFVINSNGYLVLTENGDFRKIFLEGNQLFSQRGEGDILMIFPETETRFFYGFNSNVKIEFLINEKGEVIGSKNSNGEKSETAKKLNK